MTLTRDQIEEKLKNLGFRYASTTLCNDGSFRIDYTCINLTHTAIDALNRLEFVLRHKDGHFVVSFFVDINFTLRHA